MKKIKKTRTESKVDKMHDPRNLLADELFSSNYCESMCEAESVAEALISSNDIQSDPMDNLNPLMEQLVEFFPQMPKSVAKRLASTAFNQEDEILIETTNSDSDSSCTEEEEFLSDSEEYLRDGECELCERYIKLTKHHLIPRVTWKKMRRRFKNISEALSKSDNNRMAALTEGTKLAELVPEPISTREIGNILNNTALICRPCHNMVHNLHENFELAENFHSIDLLLTDQDMVKHCKWANKQKAGKYAK